MNKKLLFIAAIFIQSIAAQAQLNIYPALPGDKLKSSVFSINVQQNGGNYQASYVYEYVKNNGSNATTNDPFNISNSGKVTALTNSNHWTCFSFGGNPVIIEITKLSGNITDCKIFPKRYNLTATYNNGKAYITIPNPNKKIYLEIDGNIKQPLFVFADTLETNIPSQSDPNVVYFGPGIHNLGLNYTPPTNITTIYIAGGAYVTGNIYTNNPLNLTVRGRGIISGEGIPFRFNGGVSAHIFFDGNSSRNCKIEGITIMKPTHYHMLSRGQFDVDNVKCFSMNNTSDGWGAGYGSGNASSCKNSFFKVNDDVWKLYGDNFVITDNVVYQQTNGHVFQFGWGGQSSRNSQIDRIDIVRSSETEPSYPASEGHPIIGWANANTGTHQTGHVFNDITVENGISRVFDLDAGGTVNIQLNNFNIYNTVKQSILPTSGMTINMSCVVVDGSCINSGEFNNSNGVSISCNNCTALSVKKNKEFTDISFYPNPVKDDIYISNIQGACSYKIYDISGKTSNTEKLKTSKTISVSNLNAGIYFLEIIDKNHIKSVRKFIKL